MVFIPDEGKQVAHDDGRDCVIELGKTPRRCEHDVRAVQQ
jgi:hypothetical protein